jgi:hypothetical protein
MNAANAANENSIIDLSKNSSIRERIREQEEINRKDNEKRRQTERIIVRAILTKAKREGYAIALDNGEEIIKLSPLKTVKAMIEECFSVDDEALLLEKDGKKGWVRLVYGNTGFDVICDYSPRLDDFLDTILEKSLYHERKYFND